MSEIVSSQDYRDGIRDQRLNGHDSSLLEIRADIKQILQIATDLNLQTQRLGDNARASAEATIKLAEAVNAEKINARDALAAQVDQTDRSNSADSEKFSKRDKMWALLISAAGVLSTTYLIVHK